MTPSTSVSLRERVRNAKVNVYTDGMCDKLGGVACYGWIALDANAVDANAEILAAGIGCAAKGYGATCNVAEYGGLIAALTWAVEREARNIVIHTDSKLVVKQVNGLWGCHAEHLLPLIAVSQGLLRQVRGRLKWIPRERNIRADALSRVAYIEELRDEP